MDNILNEELFNKLDSIENSLNAKTNALGILVNKILTKDNIIDNDSIMFKENFLEISYFEDCLELKLYQDKNFNIEQNENTEYYEDVYLVYNKLNKSIHIKGNKCFVFKTLIKKRKILNNKFKNSLMSSGSKLEINLFNLEKVSIYKDL